MAAHKIKCFEATCRGTTFAVNDGPARIAEQHFGRLHYICDKCGARWSVDPSWYLQKLAPARHVR